MIMHQLNILLVGDDKQQFKITKNLLTKIKDKAWQFNLEGVFTYEAALTKITAGTHDIYLLDNQVGGHKSVDILHKVANNGKIRPLILLTDANQGLISDATIEAGVVDCLVKSELNAPLLAQAIEHAVKYKKLQQNLLNYKQQLNTLQKSEEQYRTLFNVDVYGIEVLDQHGIITKCNSIYQKMLGYNHNEIIGQHTATFTSEQSTVIYNRKLTNLVTKGYIEGELELIGKDGSSTMVWRRVRAMYDEDGAFSGSVTYTRDITERMKAVEQISTLARAFQQSPAAVMVVDTKGEIKYINFEFTELIGYTEEEVLGQNLRQFNNWEQTAADYEAMWKTVKYGNEWREEFKTKNKKGKEYWELVIITPMFNTKNDITDFIVTLEDITKRKQATEESVKSQQRIGNVVAERISDLTNTNEAMQREIAERKRAEQELRRSRSRLKAQYKGIPVPTYSWQRLESDFMLVDYNDAAENTIQGGIGQLMGKTANNVFKDRPQVLADFEECFNKETSVTRESLYQLVSSGENRHFVTTYNFVPPNLVIVHIQDVTEQKKFETELISYRSQLEEVSKKHLKEIDQLKQSLESESSRCKRLQRSLQHTEKRLQVYDYKLANLNVSEDKLVELNNNQKELQQEIAKRKTLETQLHQSQLNLKAQYRAFPIPTYTWQVKGNDFILVKYNQATEKITPSIADFMGKPAKEMFKDRTEVLEDFTSCVKSKKVITRESLYRLLTTGNTRNFITTYNFVPPDKVIVHIQDTTEYQQIQSELKQYKQLYEATSAQHATQQAKMTEALEQEITKRTQQLHQELEQYRTLYQTVSTEHATELEKANDVMEQEAEKRTQQLQSELKGYRQLYQESKQEHVNKLTEITEALEHEKAERNKVEDALQKTEKSLTSYDAQLDEMVAKRTTDLSKLNTNLKQQFAKHKKVAESLRQSQGRLEAQYKGIPVPTYTWQLVDGDFILVDYNYAAEKSTQKRIADFKNKSVSVVFKDRTQVLNDFARCHKEKTVVKRESLYRLITTGENRYFVTTYNFVEPNLIIVHIQDITEQKQLETALKQLNHQLEALTAKHTAELSEAKNIIEQTTTERKTLAKRLNTLENNLQSYQNQLSEASQQLQTRQDKYQRVEESLRQSRAKFKAQYKGIPIPTYSWQRIGSDFVLVDYNQAAEKSTQGRIADFMGKTVRQVFKDRSRVIAAFDRCYKEKTTIRQESLYRLLTISETKYYVTTYNFVMTNLIIVHIEDITEHKWTQEALRMSQEQIELICRYDRNGTLTFVNDAYCWYFDQDRDNLVGLITPFVHKQDIRKIKTHLTSFTQKTPVQAIEHRVIKPNGQLCWLQWINRAIFDKQGNLIEIQAMGRDITRRKEMRGGK
jgi:PAS domain S-box-containing protein